MSLRVLGLAVLGVAFGDGAQAQTPFIDWASVLKPGATVTVGGISQEFAYASGPTGVASVSPPSTNMAVTLTQSVTAAGDLGALTISNANRIVRFERANGDTFVSAGGDRLTYGRASDWSRQAVVANPAALGWAYQTFSAWQSGLGMPSGSMGAASVGSITAGAATPQTGAADFAGLMGGIYSDAAGQDHSVIADMALRVNFAAHSATFATANTSDSRGVVRADLDIAGSFVSLPNHPMLFGNLSTARLSGTSSAQFYGPVAEEVGGVFTLTPTSGQGLERLAGGFGGKRGSESLPPPTTPPVTTPPPTPPPSVPSTPGAFTDWPSVLKAGATVTAEGMSREFGYASSPTGVTAADTTSRESKATLTETLGASGAPVALSLKTADRTASFAIANGDTLSAAADGKLIYARASDWSRHALLSDPAALGWAYQGFGVWETGVGHASGSLGAASVGAATAASASPQTGEQSFTGLLGGLYVDAQGQSHLLTADLGMTLYFAGRSADVWTLNTKDAGGKAYSDLDITGGLEAQAGQASFSGRLDSKVLSGPGLVQLYGPSAEEVGGTFALASRSGEGLERFAGAFGGKRGAPIPKPAPPPPPSPPAAPPSSPPGGSDPSPSGPSPSPAPSPPSALALEVGGRGAASFVGASLSGGTVSTSNGSASFLAGDPHSYLSYGAWMTGSHVDGSRVGAGVFGATTPGGAIPTSGSANFLGRAKAIATFVDGVNLQATGTFSAEVNFGARTVRTAIGFHPSVYSGGLGGTFYTTMSYAPGSNEMSGPAFNGPLTGTVTARFFGPAATEMGGTFSLTGPTAERLVGSFAGSKL